MQAFCSTQGRGLAPPRRTVTRGRNSPLNRCIHLQGRRLRAENVPYLGNSTCPGRRKHYAFPMPSIRIASSQPALQMLPFELVEFADV